MRARTCGGGGGGGGGGEGEGARAYLCACACARVCVCNAMLNRCNSGDSYVQRLDGIALMLSGYARATTIKANTFQWIGDSAMAAWGYTANVSTSSGVMVEGYDGTEGNQPRGTLVVSMPCI